MPTIAPIILIDVRLFTVGTDVYPDIRQFQIGRTPNPTRPYIPEAALKPSRLQQVAKTTADVNGSIQSDSMTLEALANTQAATATVKGTNLATGDDVTITITAPTFLGLYGSGGGNSQEAQGTLNFEATDYTVVEDE